MLKKDIKKMDKKALETMREFVVENGSNLYRVFYVYIEYGKYGNQYKAIFNGEETEKVMKVRMWTGSVKEALEIVNYAETKGLI